MVFIPLKTATASIRKEGSITDTITFNNGINAQADANADSIATALSVMASIAVIGVDTDHVTRTIKQETATE